MAKNSVPSSMCAVMVFTGIVLLLSVHHAKPTDIWSVWWVHLLADLMAIALMACPLVFWFKKG